MEQTICGTDMAPQFTKERFRLYLHYKQNEVAPEHIKIDHQLNFEQNYKHLFVARVKLRRCLSSRQHVQLLYGDDDPGHVAAIQFVKNALEKAEGLLKTLCQMPLSTDAQKTDKEELKDNDRPSMVSPPVQSSNKAVLEKECIKECDELDRIAAAANTKMVDLMARMHDFIRDDKDVTETMRTMLQQNMAPVENQHGVYIALVMIIARTTYAAQRIPRISFFYHHDVSDDEIRAAIQTLQSQLVSKRDLTRTLLQQFELIATQHKQQDGTKFIGFGLQLFQRLYFARGHYTTTQSILIVSAIASLVKSLRDEHVYSYHEHDVISRRRFVFAHGEEKAVLFEDALRYLQQMYDNQAVLPMIPWTYLLNAPKLDKMLLDFGPTILGRESRRMFTF